MADPNQSVGTCILKVDLKCCTGCQKKASIKLKSISGVNEVEYDSEKGLMTVTGDVEPMDLVRKLNKCGKETELFSVKYQIEDDDLKSDDEDETSSSSSSSSDSASSYYDPKPMEREFQEKMKQQPKKKTLLQIIRSILCCFTSKSKVVQPLPMRNRNQNRNWRVPSKFEYGAPQLRPPQPMLPYPQTIQPHHLQMMQQQQQQQMMQRQQQLQLMQHQQHVPVTGAVMPYTANMFQQAYQPYHMPNQGQTYLLPNPAQPLKFNRSLHFPPTKDGNVRLL
ncbi:PREDICTED: probable serine/threonine-protein kinase samkC [Camelina sativa]|uniref:Probable serine/threonine-protein kinase samkC n=1 Tax=Camelina sativa TaxID=90675 RepID=A0ABM0YIZ3_CAMSA|nr:PREDICTED: probable serine/threonine-protein kinase samkC [Camelina sativa]